MMNQLRSPHERQLLRFGSSCFTKLLVLSLLVLAALSATTPLFAQGNGRLVLPAQFVRELTPPGDGGSFLRPDKIFLDNRFNEVFVSDPGYNRIVVFDTSGLYKFEFSGNQIFGTADDIVVDSDGYIYVLGSTAAGKNIFVFDYDGLYLKKLELTGLPAGQTLEIDHLIIDETSTFYTIDEAKALVTSLGTDGVLKNQFPILADLTDKLRQEALYGTPQVYGGAIYIPVSTEGSVYVYDLSGNYISNIGVQGTDAGSLNFPVAVAVADGGQILTVLDKHRYVVVCYTLDGKFIGEYGGMGFSLGWFYHPGAFALDKFNRAYISQVYLNRVQVCALPDAIIQKAKSLNIKSSQTQTSPQKLETMLREEVIGQITEIH